MDLRLPNPREPRDRHPATITSGLYYLETIKWNAYALKVRVYKKLWRKKKTKIHNEEERHTIRNKQNDTEKNKTTTLDMEEWYENTNSKMKEQKKTRHHEKFEY